jgi:hypothetical protein
MKGGGKRSVTKRRSKLEENVPSAKTAVQTTEWELADDRLDEALRQTFPASDAVSMIRSAGGS